MEKNETKHSRFVTRTIITGFIGGILGGLFSIVLYYFNFMEVSPKAYILRSWLISDWTVGWKGTLFTIFLLGVLSIVISFVYYYLFRKIHSIWMGIAFGIMLWLIFAYVTQFHFPNIKQITLFSKNSIFSTLCLFILYGTFVGYAISFDYYVTYSQKR